MDLTSITPTPSALKALSHPVRLRMLTLLRVDGPATATLLATRLGLNSGATSYHLRHLASHGFVVDDDSRGNGRERWWAAAHQATRIERGNAGEEAKEAVDAFLQSVAVINTEQLQRALEERTLLPDDWRDASTFSDWGLRLTPRSARALVEALAAAIAETPEEEDDPEAGEFLVQLHAFPLPGRMAGGTIGEPE